VNLSVALSDLAANSVNTWKIVNGSVRLIDLDTDSVDSDKIVDASVANVDLAGSITASKLVGTDIDTVGTVTNGTWNATALDDAYVSDTLTASKFVGVGSTSDAVDLATAEVDGALGGANLAADSVDSSKIVDGAVATADIAANAVTGAKIAADTIDGTELADTITLDANLALNDGNVTGNGTLGTAGSRWSTIYADTLNYATALTDANTANTTVTLGNNSTSDTVSITADTAITDAQWSVSAAGSAAFAGITQGGGNVIDDNDTGTVTSAMISNDTVTSADIATGGVTTTEIANGTIAGTDLNAAIAITTSGAATFTSDVALGNGAGDTVAIDSASWDITAGGAATGFSGVSTGNLTATGAVNLSGASSLSLGSNNVSTTGFVNASNGFRNGASTGITSVLNVRNAADTGSCSLTVTGGIITASSC
jgi:hypothetical protein